MKVYGHPMSGPTRKVLTTLAEKGHEAEFILVDLTKREQKSPEHMARHPFGVVPALEDGDFSMYESRAIIRYLDATLSGPQLTPSDAKARARMDQWMSVEQCYFSSHVMTMMFQMVFGPMRGNEPDMKKVAEGKEGASKALDVVEKALASQPYLAGDMFSLADITWMPYLEYTLASQAGDLITARPHVSAWWEKIRARPSWKKATGQ